VEMNGRSFLPLLLGQPYTPNEQVYLERERHANVRKGDLSYPVRAIRTKEFLYIRNLRPDLWPAGDPEKWVAVGPYGDIDASPSKEAVLRTESFAGEEGRFYKLSCGKRPGEELYDLKKDSGQFNNVADKVEYAEVKAKLRERHDVWLNETGDPRVKGETEAFDRYQYFGEAVKAGK
jgi:N-sulfoglucosamine sulfohydrolase